MNRLFLLVFPVALMGSVSPASACDTTAGCAVGAPRNLLAQSGDSSGPDTASERPAPLLTNLQTAEAAQVSYQQVAPDIAMVPPSHAEQVWQQAPRVHNVVPSPASRGRSISVPRTEVVITEWADGRTEVERRRVR